MEATVELDGLVSSSPWPEPLSSAESTSKKMLRSDWSDAPSEASGESGWTIARPTG